MAKIKDQSFRLVNNTVLTNCYAHIAELFKQQNDKQSLHVMVQMLSEDRARSLKQNRLYWKWIGIVSSFTGLTADEQHTQLKRQFLARILCADDPLLAGTLATIKKYEHQMSKAQYEQLAQGVATMLSTTRASTKQMSKYLDDIDKFFYSKGVPLPKPDDYNWMMGGDK